MPPLRTRFSELATFIPKIAESHLEQTAMIWPGETITYAELDRKTSQVASAIRSGGLKQGDRVGAFMLNSPLMIYAWLGSLRAGCVFVPYNSALKGDFLAYQIRDSKPRLLFVDSNLKEQLPSDANLQTAIIYSEGSSHSFEEFISGEDGNFQSEKVRADSPAEIMYTSGTTGSPKGVVLSHFSLVNRVNEVAQIVNLGESDVTYNVLPLFHTSGQVMTTLPALLNGLTVVEDTWFHASRYWSYAAETKATISFLLMRTVNTLLQREDYAPNNLRAIMCGGVKLDTSQQFEQRFKVDLVEGFGMTETCGIAIFNTIDDNRRGSIGRPLPSIEAIVADRFGRPLGANVKGELLLKGRLERTLIEEYFGVPKDALFKAGGWFATGDLAYIDEDGYFYYVEREKDVIRVREENIIPSDIERAAESHPDILECAAVGVKAGSGDEEILLALKLRRKIEPVEIFMFLDKKVPFYMVPRYLLILEEIPKTPNQKISRKMVRDLGLREAIDANAIGFKATRPSQVN